MPLKPIPIEHPCKKSSKNDMLVKSVHPKEDRKTFNPSIRKAEREHTLKSIALGLVRFINRGSKYTASQIDDLIMSMQRSILRLQKEKQEMMRKNIKKKK